MRLSTLFGTGEQPYRNLVELNPDITVINCDGKIAFINHAGAQALGAENPDELIGRSVLDFIHPDNQYVVRQRVPDPQNKGQTIPQAEEKLVRLDGSVISVETTAMPITYHGRQATLVIGHDITERKLLEQSFIETNEYLNDILERSLDSIVVCDNRGYIKRPNSFFLNLLDYQTQEVIGKNLRDFYPELPGCYTSNSGEKIIIDENYLSIRKKMIHQLLGEGRISNWDSYIQSRNGLLIPVSQNIGFLHDKQGEFIGSVAIIRDITIQKKAERALRENEVTLRTLINAAPESLFLLDIDGTIITANETLARRLGTTVNELVGSNIYNYLPENLIATRKMYAEKALRNRKMIYYEDLRQDRYMANYVYPFPESKGNSNRIAVFSWDITERRHEEEELRKHRDHLDELVKEKTAELIIANKKLQKEIDLLVQVEKALRDSEQNFRSLVELSPDGIGIEHDGKVVFINSAGLKILGTESPEQIIGKQVIDLVHPDYKELVRKRVSQLNASGNISLFIELQLVRLDGSTVDVELGSTSCFYQDKLAAQAVFRDITRRKIIEKALVESEDKFRMLAETTASAIVIFQRAGIVYANPAAESLCGYTIEELKSLNFWEVIPPDYRERFKDSGMKRLRGEEVPAHFEMPILTKNNETRWIDYTAAVIDYQGEKAVLGTGVDITSRKCAEDALRKSEEQYRMLVENANSIILRMDTNGVVRYFNEFAQKFFGYAAEEIVGRNVVGTIVPENDTSGRDLAEMIRDIGHRPENYEFNQNENMRRTGERVWIAWTNKALCDDAGIVCEILCIGNDISMLKQAEKKLLNYQKQLQSLASELSLAEERERRRIAVELHDRIAQSLAFARIKIEAIKSAHGSDESERMLDEVCELIGQTIRATRTLTVEICPPILYELGFETALEWLTEQTQEQYGIKTSFANDQQQKPLDDDIQSMLFQATRELLVNVAKHAQARRAHVSIQRDDSHVCINVDDDGIGFDMSAAEKKMGSEGGFGLFSIRERLKYLGGSLECNSQAGQGTRISLIAPLKQ